MRVVHSHRRVLRCDRSLSSESAIIVLWIWFGMAIPWYRFLNERVTSPSLLCRLETPRLLVGLYELAAAAAMLVWSCCLPYVLRQSASVQ